MAGYPAVVTAFVVWDMPRNVVVLFGMSSDAGCSPTVSVRYYSGKVKDEAECREGGLTLKQVGRKRNSLTGVCGVWYVVCCLAGWIF